MPFCPRTATKLTRRASCRAFEPGALDRAKVHEKICAALGGCEAETLGITEPFDDSVLTV
jgi:hypothetical protein